jgi:hypothetical protein
VGFNSRGSWNVVFLGELGFGYATRWGREMREGKPLHYMGGYYRGILMGGLYAGGTTMKIHM